MDYKDAKNKLAWFAIKYAGGDIEIFYKRNKFSNDLKKSLQNIVKNYKRLVFEDDKEYCVRKCLSLTNREDTMQAIYLIGDAGHPESLKNKLVDIINNTIRSNQPISLKDLALNGFDLQELGYKGKEIGEALNGLLEAVLHKPEYNTRDGLIGILETLNVTWRHQ